MIDLDDVNRLVDRATYCLIGGKPFREIGHRLLLHWYAGFILAGIVMRYGMGHKDSLRSLAENAAEEMKKP